MYLDSKYIRLRNTKIVRSLRVVLCSGGALGLETLDYSIEP